MLTRFSVSACLLLAVACSGDSTVSEGEGDEGDDTQEEGLQVPSGFEITLFAEGLQGVRTLRTGPDGLLYAALSDAGRIVRISFDDAERETVAQGLDQPYGLAFHNGDLYVGEESQVVRLRGPDYTDSDVIVADLPTGGHWTREIAFGPDGMLYLSIGSSCNLCEEDDERRAAITRYRPDGSGEKVIAEGVRNAAGLAFHPPTGQLWVSQNERDWLGDDLPPEEINIIEEGGHYGWPYCYGDRIENPEYEDEDRCDETIPAALEMQAHSAPLGMVFYGGTQFPTAYRGDLFVAFHGSWNRSDKTGYKLVRVVVDDNLPVRYEDFAWGWLKEDGSVEGRPVYPEVGPDGDLYLSDDSGGRIYRIRYTGDA